MRDLHTNHKKSTITVIILALLVLTGATAGVLRVIGGEVQPAQTAAVTDNRQGSAVQPATTVRYTAKAGTSVLEQLKAHAGEVVLQDSQYGQYVESINGLKGGTNSKYWTYYVNGQMANIGAGEFVPEGGEEIVWKFE